MAAVQTDPAGLYYREHSPKGSVAWVFGHMRPRDRTKVASDCFRDAQFDQEGNLSCKCYPKDYCLKEYWCEAFAAILTVFYEPPENIPDILIAYDNGIEEWVVRFRRLLEDCGAEEIQKIIIANIADSE